MSRNFYILRDDRGRWVISDIPVVTEAGGTYRSYNEALDQLRDRILEKGLVMGTSYPEDTGFRVEAFGPGEVAVDTRPMLYSAAALSCIDLLRDRLGRKLKENALKIARRDGRHLVTPDDVMAAFSSFTMSDIADNFQERSDDGR